MSNEKRLTVTFFVILVLLIAEVVGGLISNSLALLSDAGHLLTDGIAVMLSLIATVISRKPSDSRATFGYHRIALLAALINGLTLVAISAYLFYETYQRFRAPQEINTGVMLSVAFLGLIGNIFMALILKKDDHDLNMRSAWLHVAGDLLATIGVIVAGAVIYFTRFYLADPIATLMVTLFILAGAIRIIRESLWVFLDLVPRGFEVKSISEKILDMPGVLDIHDVHLWSISPQTIAFSAHVVTEDRTLSDLDTLRHDIDHALCGEGILHNVIQFECAQCKNNMLYCKQDQKTEVHHQHA